MTLFLDPTKVRSILDGIGTKICAVTFAKKDGTQKTVTGLLRATSRLEMTERGQKHSVAMREAGRVWIAVSNPPSPDKASASFYINRVVKIRCAGQEYTA